MSAQKIGRVKSGKTKRSFEVSWNSHSKEVFDHYGGWICIGKAYSASEAMNRAEAWLYDK
jgi:hypothetical protein